MRSLFDVNALIALLDEAHSFNQRARQFWLESDRSWATCPLTQNGFVRVVSQPGYSSPTPLTQALQILDLALAAGDHEFWPDDVSIVDPALVDPTRVLGPAQVTDVYLLSLAVSHGGRLVTFDKAIPLAAVKGADSEHLLVL